ncbi:hypothetical protein ACO2Q3_17545 [Caulobacter sp. KR2-114]|uniref:hypothetical protein n=1 Tax=Caulobacter sp. KR2-114 TaxID=3400912 RepID=UPI003BFC6513
MRIRVVLAATVAVLLAATTSAAVAEAPAADATPQPDVAWLLIGAQPDFARLSIDPVKVRKGVLRFPFTSHAYYPQAGLILIKAQPGQLYGLSESALMWGRPLLGAHYLACDRTATFQAAGGQVVYFGTFDVEVAGQAPTRTVQGYNLHAREELSQDLEGARAFLKANYPGLAARLEQGAPQDMPVGQACR